ncbi:hypothetical protein [Halobacillus naozhouensis]|uniref:Uncharacterized protein n=1 Tax=Halobacillus naozhouensis TaxID=554880 RepID=A0ABY8J142_9BACI|nr:hypothetical protein [Halobacillus naozhouensis]WFT76060.1 hypothetical protein P9989_06765 [Halobacillus naozhouensis]
MVQPFNIVWGQIKRKDKGWLLEEVNQRTSLLQKEENAGDKADSLK